MTLIHSGSVCFELAADGTTRPDVYTAAMMVLVERSLETRKGTPNKDSQAHHTWHAAIHVLKTYGVLADSARRCAAALEVPPEKLSLDEDGNATASSQNEGARDWDSFWGISNFLGEEMENADAGVLPFNFEDFIWLDSVPGPYCHISPPSGA